MVLARGPRVFWDAMLMRIIRAGLEATFDRSYSQDVENGAGPLFFLIGVSFDLELDL